MDIHTGTTPLEILPVATRTASANGSAVDMRDYVGKVAFLLHSEAGSGTTPTQDVKLQDSADGSTDWQDITGATFSQITDAAGAFESIGVLINGARRYVRAVATIAGTTPSFAAGVSAVGKKQNN